MLTLAALILQATAVQAAKADDDTTVVVTAPSQSFREALDRCIARGCTPRQDIVASIRYAEVRFRSGRYYEARHTLQDAIGRDRLAAAAEPIAVAALYEATTTVALHDGEQDVARRASGSRLGVLRNGFGKDDPRFLQATLDDVDLQARLGRPDDAQSRYAALERRAREAGQPNIAAAAALRRAEWAHVEGGEHRAKQLIAGLIADPQQDAMTRTAAEALQASFARDRGDLAATDRLVADHPSVVGIGGPMLLWQSPVPSPTDQAGIDEFNAVDRVTASSDVSSPLWVDIGFQIRPDGTVEVPEVLRGSRATRWARPIQAAIAVRRYSSTTLPADQRYRIERWTLTADYYTPKDSFIRRRGDRPHYVQIDLTSTAPTTIRHQ